MRTSDTKAALFEMKNDELHLRLMTSQTERMTLDEFVSILRFRTILLFYIAPLVVLVLTDARSGQGLPQWKNAAIYLAGIAAFQLTVLVVVILLRRAVRKPGPLTVHMTPVLLTGALVSNITGETMIVLFGGTPVSFPWGAIALYVFFWLVAEAGFAFAARFVVPVALAELRGSDVKPGPAAIPAAIPVGGHIPDPAPSVSLGNHRIAVDDLLWIRGEGKHVRIGLRGQEEVFALFALPTLLALLPAGAGMQVHRSIWVARSAVTGFFREKRDLRLVLLDGTVLPVGPSRQAEVMAWLRQTQGTAPEGHDRAVASLH